MNMNDEQLQAFKVILDRFNDEDHLDAILAWMYDSPEDIKTFVDKLNAYVQSKFELEQFLEM